MRRSLPLCAVLTVGAAVFVGCGIFFAFQDLGTANDYAAIASFFLALVTAVGSLASFMHAKQEHAATTQAGQGEQLSPGEMLILGNPKIVQQGSGNSVIYKETQKYGRRARKGNR